MSVRPRGSRVPRKPFPGNVHLLLRHSAFLRKADEEHRALLDEPVEDAVVDPEMPDSKLVDAVPEEVGVRASELKALLYREIDLTYMLAPLVA